VFNPPGAWNISGAEHRPASAIFPHHASANSSSRRATGPQVLSSVVAAVEVEGLVVRYGDLTAVRGTTWRAEAGAVTALLGPNGAGKTSTVEVLEGYRRPTGGTVRVLGLDPAAQHRALVARMGVMLQRGGVYPTMRAGEAVDLYGAYYGRPRRSRELLALVGLTERSRSPWRQLSGGEQQRLALALALAGEPDVAFLDEPTASVDVAGRQVVREVIRSLAGRGCCVVLTTHELDEAERVADRVVIVDRGQVVADGTPDELRRSGPAEVRFGAAAGLDTAALAPVLGAAVTEVAPGEYVVAAEGTPALVAALTSWLAARDVPLADLRAGRQRLEDVFLRLTSERSSAAPADEPAGRRRGRR
jgi:ABC-2 type transport system ATP-binding protein